MGQSEVTLQRQVSPSLLRKFAEVWFINAEVRPCSAVSWVCAQRGRLCGCGALTPRPSPETPAQRTGVSWVHKRIAVVSIHVFP